MHLNAQKPVLVPEKYRDEIEKISKAALMDIAWDYAVQLSGGFPDEEAMQEFRSRRETILIHRKQAKSGALG